jgi:hypothetical protein
MNSDAETRSSSGLSILWDIIVAPRDAFAALRDRPYLGWAFLVTCVLGMAGAFLQIPAGEHIAVATFSTNAAHDPRIAAMTPAQQQSALEITKAFQHWFWLAYPLIVAVALLVTSLVLSIFNAIGRGDGTFRRSLALAANVALLNFGISYFLLGVLVRVRGGDAFSTSLDLVLTLPSVAWAVPGASLKVATFLSSFNVFTIWSFVLLALGQRDVSRVSPLWAWVGAAVIALGPAFIATAFAR